MSAEQNAVEGLSEGERAELRSAMERDLDLNCDDDHLFKVVERIVADRVRLAVDEFAAEVERRIESRRSWAERADWPVVDRHLRIVRDLREQGAES